MTATSQTAAYKPSTPKTPASKASVKGRGKKKAKGRSKKRSLQLDLSFSTWGGRRRGAGRKPERPGRVTHSRRPELSSRYPVHVSMRLDGGLPSLRSPQLRFPLEECLVKGREAEGFRIAHYSIQRHHIHLIVEANDAKCLSRGIQGLAIRIAKRINRELGHRGPVFVDRYFERILRTPKQVRHCLCYVLNNARRHAAQRRLRMEREWVDPCSSGPYFDGYQGVKGVKGVKGVPYKPHDDISPVVAPETWLLRVGWKKFGLISTDEVPGGQTRRAATEATRETEDRAAGVTSARAI